MPSELQVAIAEGTDRTGMIASFVDDGRNRWLKNVFASFDADGNGTLSSSELRSALVALERCESPRASPCGAGAVTVIDRPPVLPLLHYPL